MPDDLDALLAAVPPEVADLVRASDELVRRTDPDVVRSVWPHQKTVGYGVGPRKGTEHYAYLAVYGQVLNLGFNHGAALNSGGLLDGAGKSFRKLRVRGVETLQDPRLADLLRAARAERLQALGRP
ncbi:hypothetical protein ACI78V_07625 [Geodermatophilus sp. SYSU D00742]